MRKRVLVSIDVQALVDIAQQIICRADVELPDIFSFPGSERFGINGFDVGVGEQAKHLEAFGRFEFFAEGFHGIGIENIAAQSHA